MKALSIQLPWADLIAQGKKTIETRTWTTTYRGPLLICASKKPHGPNAGHAVCIVDLMHVRPMTVYDQQAAMCGFYPGAKAWLLENIRPLTPFPVRGMPGIFEVTASP